MICSSGMCLSAAPFTGVMNLPAVCSMPGLVMSVKPSSLRIPIISGYLLHSANTVSLRSIRISSMIAVPRNNFV